MRKFAWLLLAGFALPALAAKSVTVDQMNQWLTGARRKSDTKLAREIAGRRLSERATPTELAHWQAGFSAAHTRDALLALADASQFLALPQNQILRTPPPGLQSQVAMLSSAVKYAAKTISKLPDFFATRETLYFEDMPEQSSNPQSISVPGAYVMTGESRSPSPRITPTSSGESEQSLPAPAPLHLANHWSIVVTYRDGTEVPAVNSAVESKPQTAEGFTTSGEFGPILSVVLGDAVHGKLEWGYWEQRSPNPEAVFRYSVPRSQSHYTVLFPNFHPSIDLHPAYHGEIAIDPATGAILRLTVIADPKPPYQRFQADMMVSYAPVAIGGRTYICPVKGVAISKIPVAEATPDPNYSGPLQTQLNDISFTNYHVFRTDMTILP